MPDPLSSTLSRALDFLCYVIFENVGRSGKYSCLYEHLLEQYGLLKIDNVRSSYSAITSVSYAVLRELAEKHTDVLILCCPYLKTASLDELHEAKCPASAETDFLHLFVLFCNNCAQTKLTVVADERLTVLLRMAPLVLTFPDTLFNRAWFTAARHLLCLCSSFHIKRIVCDADFEPVLRMTLLSTEGSQCLAALSGVVASSQRLSGRLLTVVTTSCMDIHANGSSEKVKFTLANSFKVLMALTDAPLNTASYSELIAFLLSSPAVDYFSIDSVAGPVRFSELTVYSDLVHAYTHSEAKRPCSLSFQLIEAFLKKRPFPLANVVWQELHAAIQNERYTLPSILKHSLPSSCATHSSFRGTQLFVPLLVHLLTVSCAHVFDGMLANASFYGVVEKALLCSYSQYMVSESDDPCVLDASALAGVDADQLQVSERLQSGILCFLSSLPPRGLLRSYVLFLKIPRYLALPSIQQLQANIVQSLYRSNKRLFVREGILAYLLVLLEDKQVAGLYTLVDAYLSLLEEIIGDAICAEQPSSAVLSDDNFIVLLGLLNRDVFPLHPQSFDSMASSDSAVYRIIAVLSSCLYNSACISSWSSVPKMSHILRCLDSDFQSTSAYFTCSVLCILHRFLLQANLSAGSRLIEALSATSILKTLSSCVKQIGNLSPREYGKPDFLFIFLLLSVILFLYSLFPPPADELGETCADWLDISSIKEVIADAIASSSQQSQESVFQTSSLFKSITLLLVSVGLPQQESKTYESLMLGTLLSSVLGFIFRDLSTGTDCNLAYPTSQSTFVPLTLEITLLVCRNEPSIADVIVKSLISILSVVLENPYNVTILGPTILRILKREFLLHISKVDSDTRIVPFINHCFSGGWMAIFEAFRDVIHRCLVFVPDQELLTILALQAFSSRRALLSIRRLFLVDEGMTAPPQRHFSTILSDEASLVWRGNLKGTDLECGFIATIWVSRPVVSCGIAFDDSADSSHKLQLEMRFHSESINSMEFSLQMISDSTVSEETSWIVELPSEWDSPLSSVYWHCIQLILAPAMTASSFSDAQISIVEKIKDAQGYLMHTSPANMLAQVCCSMSPDDSGYILVLVDGVIVNVFPYVSSCLSDAHSVAQWLGYGTLCKAVRSFVNPTVCMPSGENASTTEGLAGSCTSSDALLALARLLRMQESSLPTPRHLDYLSVTMEPQSLSHEEQQSHREVAVMSMGAKLRQAGFLELTFHRLLCDESVQYLNFHAPIMHPLCECFSSLLECAFASYETYCAMNNIGMSRILLKALYAEHTLRTPELLTFICKLSVQNRCAVFFVDLAIIPLEIWLHNSADSCLTNGALITDTALSLVKYQPDCAHTIVGALLRGCVRPVCSETLAAMLLDAAVKILQSLLSNGVISNALYVQYHIAALSLDLGCNFISQRKAIYSIILTHLEQCAPVQQVQVFELLLRETDEDLLQAFMPRLASAPHYATLLSTQLESLSDDMLVRFLRVDSSICAQLRLSADLLYHQANSFSQNSCFCRFTGSAYSATGFMFVFSEKVRTCTLQQFASAFSHAPLAHASLLYSWQILYSHVRAGTLLPIHVAAVLSQFLSCTLSGDTNTYSCLLKLLSEEDPPRSLTGDATFSLTIPDLAPIAVLLDMFCRSVLDPEDTHSARDVLTKASEFLLSLLHVATELYAAHLHDKDRAEQRYFNAQTASLVLYVLLLHLATPLSGQQPRMASMTVNIISNLTYIMNFGKLIEPIPPAEALLGYPSFLLLAFSLVSPDARLQILICYAERLLSNVPLFDTACMEAVIGDLYGVLSLTLDYCAYPLSSAAIDLVRRCLLAMKDVVCALLPPSAGELKICEIRPLVRATVVKVTEHFMTEAPEQSPPASQSNMQPTQSEATFTTDQSCDEQSDGLVTPMSVLFDLSDSDSDTQSSTMYVAPFTESRPVLDPLLPSLVSHLLNLLFDKTMSPLLDFAFKCSPQESEEIVRLQRAYIDSNVQQYTEMHTKRSKLRANKRTAAQSRFSVRAALQPIEQQGGDLFASIMTFCNLLYVFHFKVSPYLASMDSPAARDLIASLAGLFRHSRRVYRKLSQDASNMTSEKAAIFEFQASLYKMFILDINTLHNERFECKSYGSSWFSSLLDSNARVLISIYMDILDLADSADTTVSCGFGLVRAKVCASRQSAHLLLCSERACYNTDDILFPEGVVIRICDYALDEEIATASCSRCGCMMVACNALQSQTLITERSSAFACAVCGAGYLPCDATVLRNPYARDFLETKENTSAMQLFILDRAIAHVNSCLVFLQTTPLYRRFFGHLTAPVVNDSGAPVSGNLGFHMLDTFINIYPGKRGHLFSVDPLVHTLPGYVWRPFCPSRTTNFLARALLVGVLGSIVVDVYFEAGWFYMEEAESTGASAHPSEFDIICGNVPSYKDMYCSKLNIARDRVVLTERQDENGRRLKYILYDILNEPSNAHLRQVRRLYFHKADITVFLPRYHANTLLSLEIFLASGATCLLAFENALDFCNTINLLQLPNTLPLLRHSCLFADDRDRRQYLAAAASFDASADEFRSSSQRDTECDSNTGKPPDELSSLQAQLNKVTLSSNSALMSDSTVARIRDALSSERAQRAVVPYNMLTAKRIRESPILHEIFGSTGLAARRLLDTACLFQTYRLKYFTELFSQRMISAYAYLMTLNCVAGRSFNAAHPIFPLLTAGSPAQYRNLLRPLGAQNPARINVRLDKNIELLQDMYDLTNLHALLVVRNGFYLGYDARKLANFTFAASDAQDPVSASQRLLDYMLKSPLYGTYISHNILPTHFLFRLEPYTTLQRQQQEGVLDHYNRMFTDILSHWEKVFNEDSTAELLPDMFSVPEAFVNLNGLDCLMHDKGGDAAADAQPASVPADTDADLCLLGPVPPLQPETSVRTQFVRIGYHRFLLEQVGVGWIMGWADLIFGFKQRDLNAVESFNCYSETVYNINTLQGCGNDLSVLTANITRSSYYGASPLQLFTLPLSVLMTLSFNPKLATQKRYIDCLISSNFATAAPEGDPTGDSREDDSYDIPDNIVVQYRTSLKLPQAPDFLAPCPWVGAPDSKRRQATVTRPKKLSDGEDSLACLPSGIQICGESLGQASTKPVQQTATIMIGHVTPLPTSSGASGNLIYAPAAQIGNGPPQLYTKSASNPTQHCADFCFYDTGSIEVPLLTPYRLCSNDRYDVIYTFIRSISGLSPLPSQPQYNAITGMPSVPSNTSIASKADSASAQPLVVLLGSGVFVFHRYIIYAGLDTGMLLLVYMHDSLFADLRQLITGVLQPSASVSKFSLANGITGQLSSTAKDSTSDGSDRGTATAAAAQHILLSIHASKTKEAALVVSFNGFDYSFPVFIKSSSNARCTLLASYSLVTMVSSALESIVSVKIGAYSSRAGLPLYVLTHYSLVCLQLMLDTGSTVFPNNLTLVPTKVFTKASASYSCILPPPQSRKLAPQCTVCKGSGCADDYWPHDAEPKTQRGVPPNTAYNTHTLGFVSPTASISRAATTVKRSLVLPVDAIDTFDVDPYRGIIAVTRRDAVSLYNVINSEYLRHGVVYDFTQLTDVTISLRYCFSVGESAVVRRLALSGLAGLMAIVYRKCYLSHDVLLSPDHALKAAYYLSVHSTNGYCIGTVELPMQVPVIDLCFLHKADIATHICVLTSLGAHFYSLQTGLQYSGFVHISGGVRLFYSQPDSCIYLYRSGSAPNVVILPISLLN